MRNRRFSYSVLTMSMLLAVAGGGAPSRADETFFCADGSSVTIDSSNRAAMQDHPCVQAWFANDRARRQALLTNANDQQTGDWPGGAAPRYPVLRALALRDPQQRSVYFVWARARAAEEQPVRRWAGAAKRTHVRSLLDKPVAQAPTRTATRIRFRRR